MDITHRFNQLIILVILLCLTLFAKCALAKGNCKQYYGLEVQNNLKDLKELSQFAKNTQFDTVWVEYQYNGFSVSKSEYEKLVLRDKKNKLKSDPNMRMP